jgi:hypothetical protein
MGSGARPVSSTHEALLVPTKPSFGSFIGFPRTPAQAMVSHSRKHGDKKGDLKELADYEVKIREAHEALKPSNIAAAAAAPSTADDTTADTAVTNDKAEVVGMEVDEAVGGSEGLRLDSATATKAVIVKKEPRDNERRTERRQQRKASKVGEGQRPGAYSISIFALPSKIASSLLINFPHLMNSISVLPY